MKKMKIAKFSIFCALLGVSAFCYSLSNVQIQGAHIVSIQAIEPENSRLDIKFHVELVNPIQVPSGCNASKIFFKGSNARDNYRSLLFAKRNRKEVTISFDDDLGGVRCIVTALAEVVY